MVCYSRALKNYWLRDSLVTFLCFRTGAQAGSCWHENPAFWGVYHLPEALQIRPGEGAQRLEGRLQNR